MNQLILRSNRLQYEISEILPIILEEYMEDTSI